MSEFRAQPLYGVIGGYGGLWIPTTMRRGTPYFTYYAMSRTAQVIQNIAMNKLIVDNIGALSGNMKLMLQSGFPEIAAQVSAGDEGNVTRMLDDLVNDYQGLYANWKAGVWHGVGSAYSSAMEQFTATGQFLYAYKSLAVQTGVTPRMRRHWMRLYRPTVPMSSMAWLLWKRDVIGEDRFDLLASFEGWSDIYIGYLKQAYERWPSIWASVRLWQRGEITSEKLHAVFKQEGYPPFYNDRFKQLYRALPTIGQAARMFLRGAINSAQYSIYAAMSGWEDEDIDRMMVNYLGYPTTREAFYMHRRGIITRTSRDSVYKAHGYLTSWHELITRNYQKIFNPLNAFKLMARGKISTTEFYTICFQNGWPAAQTPLFETLYKNVPTSHESFFMWAKGLIDAPTRDRFYQAYGWMPEDHWRLTENYYYVPTLYDLFRIADYVEIDEIWAADVMTRRGIRPSDQAKLWPMLKIRPLRNEIARQVLLWIGRYELGWCSDTDLDTALQDYVDEGYIQATEKELLTEEAYLKYEDELMREQITIWMWYFRMAAVTEVQYLAALTSLGIRVEKANLMVEEQKAMGYYGYY